MGIDYNVLPNPIPIPMHPMERNFGRKRKMVIGAVITGFLVVALLLETIGSGPGK
jgi:hypothetical protein